MTDTVPFVLITKTLVEHSMADSFKSAARNPADITQVTVYAPDWNNIANDDFLKNAKPVAMRCLIPGKGSMEFKKDGNEWKFTSLFFNKEHADRIADAVNFAKNWSKAQAEKYEAPRLFENPPNETILWLPGKQDVFIKAYEWKTKASDPFVTDKDYLNNLRQEEAQRENAYKDKGPSLGG